MAEESDKFGFGAMIRKLQAAKAQVPKQLAYAGQLYFQQNFDRQQWDGAPWEKRKTETKRSEGKALLVSTGKLRGAMSHTIRSYDWKKIVWGVDIVYAKYLNFGVHGTVKAHKRTATITRKVKGGYGGLTASGRLKTSSAKVKFAGAEHTVKAHKVDMPARQFMGTTEELLKKFSTIVETEFGKVMNPKT